MFRLVYLSSAVEPFSQSELLALLTKSRVKNNQHSITGMLLYKDGNFLQILEGDEAGVRQLLATIEHDPRHRGTIVLVEEPVDEPLFGDWSMGFRNLSDPALADLPGFNKFMNHDLDMHSFKDDPSGCLELLNLFKQGR